jgi:hypothetical protein
MEYIIEGDTDKYKDCLVFVCGSSKENAEKALHRILYNPTDNDKRLIEGYQNLRIAEVDDKDCWWNYNCD